MAPVIFVTIGRFTSFPWSSRIYASLPSTAILTLPLSVTFRGAFGAWSPTDQELTMTYVIFPTVI
jgi:hypothetical protein